MLKSYRLKCDCAVNGKQALEKILDYPRRKKKDDPSSSGPCEC